MGSLALLSHFAASTCTQQFLGFKSWDFYLSHDSACQIINFPILGSHSGILLILLAIADDLFRAVGLLAVIFIIYTGFKYIFSSGSPDEAGKAMSTGINALVGLGISLVAVLFVSFLGGQLDSQNRSAGQVGQLDLSHVPNPLGTGDGSIIQTGLSITFSIMGVLAFLVIIIAGMNYAFSQGDPQATGKAKSAIIYAFIGLIIAILAQSIVSFAVNTHP
jgi:hypothetical protein